MVNAMIVVLVRQNDTWVPCNEVGSTYHSFKDAELAILNAYDHSFSLEKICETFKGRVLSTSAPTIYFYLVDVFAFTSTDAEFAFRRTRLESGS
jgi:hypothetical protein